MDILECYDIEEFCEKLDYEISANKPDYCSVVAKYEEAREIIRELIYYDYELKFIILEDPEYSGYDDEYEIAISNNEIYCEKKKVNCKYIESDAQVVYFMENVNSKVISSFPCATKKYEVEISDRDYFDEHDLNAIDCIDKDLKNDVNFIKDDDENMHGFTISKSNDNGYSNYSFYTSEKITDDVMNKLVGLLKDF